MQNLIINRRGQAGRLGLASLALPVLAGRHGDMTVERFLPLVRRAVERECPPCLKRLWLVVPPGTPCSVLRGLQSDRADGEADSEHT